MEKIKKIIVGVVVGIILLATIVTVLNVSRIGIPMANNSDGVFGIQGDGVSESSMSGVMMGSATKSSNTASFSEGAVTVSPEATQNVPDNKIIRTGNLNLKVNSADEATGKISQIAKDNGGEVFSSNFYQTSKNIKSGTIEVKVPVDKFEKTFAEIKTVATLVARESISGQNVTMEYADLQIRLKNKQAEEQSYLNILDRAGKIDDVLAVTREVARTRGEIESLQGRIKFLDSQTDKSSISVSLTEDANITFSDSWRPWQVMKETFNTLFKDIQGIINFIIVLVIRVIPVIILYVIIFGFVYWVGKKIYFRIKK
ncbi:MAG: hypothetical protein COX30_03665 [Candidatus Moranbacteria bacterium CG23_combo_of_CG06-09_8_20_14_all_39_10]|nr:MAG: hypothetical protein COX30_03665 [Candidatus Moranbacteria bacterium CG23_combo_of_CG06-09_8_20_14_all_39_10]